ncbi:MAG: hypothetical protein PHU42_03285 [Patescibacteria group bacterium]|nr:hypothetical protein [Patescibacteria group bacterium]
MAEAVETGEAKDATLRIRVQLESGNQERLLASKGEVNIVIYEMKIIEVNVKESTTSKKFIIKKITGSSPDGEGALNIEGIMINGGGETFFFEMIYLNPSHTGWILKMIPYIEEPQTPAV